MPPTAADTKTFWRSWAERDGQQAPAEAQATPAAGFSRRAFLEAAGFAVTALSISGCQEPRQELLLAPVQQLPGATPGRSLRFASTCGGCPAACGLLVTTKDGRPLKLEGLPSHPLSQGGLCAVGQALPMGLYDRLRFKQPLERGRPATWAAVDQAIMNRLEEIRAAGGAVRFVTGSHLGPTAARVIGRFLGAFADGKEIIVDCPSASAILEAHAMTHGMRLLPRYRFDRATVIASFGADFLGTWISPVEFTAGWRKMRGPGSDDQRMSYHAQFEALLSLTGSKADERNVVLPEEYAGLLENLLQQLGRLADDPRTAEAFPLARRLWEARGASLVISDSPDLQVQVLVNHVNQQLNNYGSTLDVHRPSRQRRSNDAELMRLFEELEERKIAALFVAGDDPFHHLPAQDEWRKRLASVSLLVSLAERPDAFSAMAHFVCPDHHALESWSDAEPVAGLVSIGQPTVAPLNETRSLLESVSAWSGTPANALELIKATLRGTFFVRKATDQSFADFWEEFLQRGFFEFDAEQPGNVAYREIQVPQPLDVHAPGGLTLVLHAKTGMPGGRHAHNAWLQEMPDPVTKVTWENPACVSPALARRLNLADGDIVRIAQPEGGPAMELPVCIQPGQHDGAVAVAIGYGVPGTERFAQIGPRWIGAGSSLGENGLVGVNAAPFMQWRAGRLHYVRHGVELFKTARRRALATTQEHHTLHVPANVAPAGAEVRDAARETALRELRLEEPQHHPHQQEAANLWPDDHQGGDVQWGMVIDLNACTGCSACVIACQVENNIPVVGRDEVVRQREMHWLRVDRYYAADADQIRVVHQPMLCQHCGHAPCETVCPVLATAHSADGLNQQTYNRCVGTRYCANNCPYKVRRFNWFNYPRDDALANLALNPDVTVRMRGVMEKCTFCVQRLREAGIEARALQASRGSAPQTACQQSCPAQAITFGNLNDHESAVSRAARDRRAYKVLDELGVKPAVTYLKVVRQDHGDPHA
jgi:molybdopterin-containing oxidoreductase family iron-sulfur binding subunit